MANVQIALPGISVRLYKTIIRKTVDGQTTVSDRYAGKDEFIDLTPFLNDRSSVRTSKSVREPAGAFSITFADKAEQSFAPATGFLSASALESVYGLVEPMDLVEIRMFHGIGKVPKKYPIIMRGFVSDVNRSQTVGADGRPERQVVINGQDYGKIWQMFQVIYLAAYAEGQALLTNFGLWELFGVKAENALTAADFVRTMVEKVINPHLDGFLPTKTPMPRKLETSASILVKHGVVNNSYQQMQGSIYDILRHHGDIGVWNELYTEDREDGVHVVYRPIPAIKISADSQEPAAPTGPSALDQYNANIAAKKVQFEALKKEWRAAQDAEVAPLVQEGQQIAAQARAATGEQQRQLANQAIAKFEESDRARLALAAKYEAQYDALKAEIEAPPPAAAAPAVSSGGVRQLIQDDAPAPVYVSIDASLIVNLSVSRTDANVANFFWVNNSRFDLIDDMQRKLASIPQDDGKVSLKDYPNSAVKYYGVRPMYAETQQAEDTITNVTSGQEEADQASRSTKQEAWIDKRRRLMIEMNKDNVVFERGSAVIKGGLMRPDGIEAMKAGDYALFRQGRMEFEAYVVQIEHNFQPFQGYTSTVVFERSTGFVERVQMGGGRSSPWLAEQATSNWDKA
jgi:hypothetical protein